MITVKFVADDDHCIRDVSIDENSCNVEKAMLLVNLRIVEQQLLELVKDDWSVEE